MKLKQLFIVISMIMLMLPASAEYTLQKDFERSGNYNIDLNISGNLLYSYNADDSYISSEGVIIDEDNTNIVVGDYDDNLVAFWNSTTKWKTALLGYIQDIGTIDLLTGDIYIGTYNYFYKVNKTGGIQWQIDISGSVDSCIIYQDNVIINTWSGTIALSKSNGSTIWYNNTLSTEGSPMLLNSYVYVYDTYPTKVVKLNALDGTFIWSRELPNSADDTGGIASDGTYIYAGKSKLSTDGVYIWNNTDTTGDIITNPVIDNSYVYINTIDGSNNHYLSKIDKSTGVKVFETFLINNYNTGRAIPVVVNEYSIVCSYTNLYIINQSGEIERTITNTCSPESKINIYDGIIYITDGDSVYAYNFYSPPEINQCNFLDFSECNYYDLGCYFRVLLNYLYYAPGCYLTMLLDSLYNMMYNIVSIPIGFIDAIFVGFGLCFITLTGLILDINSLGGNVTNTITNTMGELLPSGWTALIILGFLIVVALRIYYFLKDISILGFKL